MAIPASGPISLTTIQTEFGGTNPIGLSEYYKGGAYVSAGDTAPNVPTSGTITINNFYGAAVNIQGQAQYTTAGTYTWTCPAGVTSVSALCVGGGSGGACNGNGSLSYFISTGVLYGGAGGTSAGGTGGGGSGGGKNGGGGGAGGYTSAGGNGGTGIYVFYGGGGVGIFGGTGAGGGGGGAYTGGAGASGGTSPVGYSGSGLYGGGQGNACGSISRGGGGGGLRYSTNSIAVTPGTGYTVVVGAGGGSAGRGAVRIIWGTGRTYPNTSTANVQENNG